MVFNRATGKNKLCLRMLIVSLLTIGFTAEPAHAQTFAEWFKQSSTQKKYLVQQIAALQVYSTYLRKGYAVAKGGLGSISGSLLSENGLHSNYYTSLKNVNPAIAGNGQVKEIVRWQNDILLLTSSWNKIDALAAGEARYLEAVRTALLTDCTQVINTLQEVVSDGKLEMSDADRLKLIAKLHGQMKDNYRFATGFTSQANAYAAQRSQERINTLTLKNTYGIN
ncbi:hypothetical protein ACQ86K_01075 [Mucilaginibacter sp. P19]|uniref:hypothetical protein n=1 Tax=Mucilaginibacter sp. P19 TaxID=3423947 RepID=UPI003D668371